MVEENAVIARWGFATMLIFASLMAAAFVCWLHEHGIHPSKSVIKFLHRPLGEVLIVLVCVGAFVHHGATKGFLGGPRMMAPREMQTGLVSEPETAVPVAGMFSTYTNAVTNVCATGIKPAETSVFLRAHWPSNLYPAPTGIEVYAAPQLSSNAWVGVGTATVDASDNSTIIEIPYPLLPDGWASSMFFMFGLNIDTDGDGLSDAFERIVTKTNPDLADTDGDGMPDGWEYSNGLNPLSDPSDDEANADADGDGLSNIAEMDNGTDPQKRDSDDDGIDDLAELGAVRQLDDFVWFDTSGGVNILANEATSSIDDKVWTVALHYPAIIGGTVYDRLTIDSNALVYLIPSNGVAVTQYNRSWQRLPADSLARTNIAIAVNWRDMEADRNSGAEIRVADISSNCCTIVEFRNLQRYNYSSDKMTAQVVVPGGTNGTIMVSYQTLSQNLDGRSASVGLMDSTSRTYTNTNKYYSLQWAYDKAGSVTPSMTLSYRVGTGTNPLEKDTDGDGLHDDEEIFVTGTDPCFYDTDGDGLSDGNEVGRQTNPLCVDTDGDGMSDGWEVKYGLDPLTDDALGDLDEDGLPNVCEYYLHTKVGIPDTDGDGLTDGSEAAWIDTHATVPWFNTSGGTVLLSSVNADKALFPVELPTAITLCGEAVTHALVDVNGIVHFGRTSTTGGVDSVDGVGDLGYDRNFRTVAVAPFSADLYARSALQSKITVKTLTSAGTQYAVFDFARIGTYSGSANEISFQISVPLNCESNVVYVRYGDVVNASSYNISIGAQGSWNFPKLKYWYGQTPNVTNGMVMAYHFGCGSDPLLRDSDDDGLEDYLEFELGTNPHYEDSDLDGLDDKWETTYNLNPLSGEGDDGADGDPDGDGLSNAREYEYDTNPVSLFTDADLIPDGVEVGYITTNAPLPWLVFDSYEDLTTLISATNRRCVNCALPLPLRIQGENVTNLTISANGIVFFNRAGYANPGDTTSAESFTYKVDEDALVLAPFLQYAYIRSDIPDRQTSIRYGVATHEGAGYLLIEYLNSYYNTSTRPTNSISFQLAVPMNCPDRAYARYKDVLGTYMKGKNASVGMQSFDGRWMQSWCYHEDNRITDDLSLEFVFGTNSDPCYEDSDNDGLDDDEELQHGTNLCDNDSDADGLPDGWEVCYGLDPLSAIGENGAQGDFDGDGLLNIDEYRHETNPACMDTDDDGLSDLQELGGITTNSLPWLQFETQTNLTASFEYATGSVVTWPLPEPIYLHGVCVTEVTVDSNGLVYFNRKGTRRTSSAGSESRMTDSWTINANSYTVAPYWDYLYLTEATPESVILAGTAINGANRYLVVQYDGVCPYDNRTRQGASNSVSWQLAVPFGDADRMYIRYSNQIGTTDGREASVGYQDFNGARKVSYCYRETGKIFGGASVAFAVGTNTDPLNADTLGDGAGDYAVYQSQVDPSTHDADDDGLPDAEERARGTNLLNADTDGDGMTDGWEVKYGFNPCVAADADGDADNDGVSNLEECRYGSNPHSADTDGDGLSDGVEVELGTDLTNSDTDNDGLDDSYEYDAGLDPCHPDTDRDGLPDGWEVDHGLDPDCATGDDGTNGDPDHDGLSNIDEYQNGSDPQDPDTDGDGVSDGVEVGQGSDPTDASDHGVAPPADKFRELAFNIYGDYAAWEMTIEGLGPDDMRTQVITMGAPGARREVSKKLRKGNSYRLSMRWLNCDGHNDSQAPWYCWQALIDGLPSQCSFNHSYIEGYCVRIPQRNNIVVGNGWIAENEGGLLTSHVHSSQKNSDGGSGAGNVAGGLVATLYVLDDPKLMPDFDRNGKIDANDETLADLGRVFRFWINDDEDDDATDGKYAESPSVDIPGARTGVWEFDGRDPDLDDDEVNGWRDLIDFTPIYMDVSCIHGLPKKIRDNLTFKLRHDSEAVNVVWTDLAKTSVGMFQKGTVAVCGRELDENSYEAETETVDAEGLEIPDALLRKMCSGTSDKGVMFVEGRKATSSPLKLDVYYGDQKVATGELDMELSSVEDMYWFYSLHGAEDVDYFNLPGHYTPGNLMDGPKDRDVFFTHGFNVSAEDARAWGSEVFKRLWQSGSDARFHMVAWPGNYNWTGNWANGLHYQRDVYQALKCANAFKRLVEREQGDSSKRVVMAQSLGNMMACEAFRQGLAANQYFMFDAAVASEAIDAAYHNNSDATRSRYVPSDWIPYDSMSWAANWYRWFKDDPSDSRGKMGWPDYFKTALTHVGSVCNYYSTGDPVFMEDTSVPSVLTGVFHWPTLHWTWPFIDLNITAEANCWQKQETHKGVEPIAGNLKGGWGFYWWMESSGDDECPVFYSAATTSVMVANGSITNNPVFYYLGTQMDNRNASQDDIWFALAEYVPAVSSPVGGNRIWSEAGKDVNLNDNSSQGVPRPNGWGRAHNVFGASWFHSDMKDMAFFYVYKLYEQLVTKGSLQ